MPNLKPSKSGLWVLGGQLIVAVGLIIGVKTLSYLVTPEEFGKLSLILGVGSLLSSACCNPIFQAGMRFIHDASLVGKEAAYRKYFRRLTLSTSMVAMGFMLVFGLVLSSQFNLSRYAVFLACLLFVVESVRGLELALLGAVGLQRRYAVWNSLESWLRYTFAVCFAYVLSGTSEAVLLGYLVAVFLVMLSFSASEFLSKPAPQLLDQSEAARLRQDILRFAIPLAPLAITGWITSIGDRYAIAKLSNLTDAGIYAATYGLFSKPFIMLSTAAELHFRPMLFESVAKSDRTQVRKLVSAMVVALFVTGGIGALLCAFFAQFWVRLLLSPTFHSGYNLVPWIAGGCFLWTLCLPFELILKAYKKTSGLLAGQLVGAIVAIVTVISLVSKLGLMGAAIAIPIYYGLQVIATLLAAKLAYRRELAQAIEST